MKITERRLRSIIKSVIKETYQSREDALLDYHTGDTRMHPDDPNYSPSRLSSPMNVGNRREDPYDRAVRIAKLHCPDCRFDGMDYVFKIEDMGDLYSVSFNDGDVQVEVPGEFSDEVKVKVYRGMTE